MSLLVELVHEEDPLSGCRHVKRPLLLGALVDGHLGDQPRRRVHVGHLPALVGEGSRAARPPGELHGAGEVVAGEVVADAHREPRRVALVPGAGELEVDVEKVVTRPRQLHGVLLLVEDEAASDGPPRSGGDDGPRHGAVDQSACKRGGGDG